MADQMDVSVVIGFKDWGLRRLLWAVRTLADSFGELHGEVIVSDFGSADSTDTRAAVEAAGGRYVYTETDGVWSRTRALNAGFAVSTGQVLVATDADMVFSSGSMEVIGRRVLSDPHSALLLQCRDLPATWSDADLDERGLDWDAFDREGRRRPRWGMGGMMAVSRETFHKVRGYDERMHTYGGEDIDFAWRVRRAGNRLVWIEHPDVRMYHVWHPSTAARHALSPMENAAVEANKQIMREDKTFTRNVTGWAHRPPDAPPLVSVVISTFNRSRLLLDAIHSVQAQTVQDFEVVVVDDGSTDDTRDVVASLRDPRIRYVYQENAGVACARNRGVDESCGLYVAVLDDDDIALPWRLEAQFGALTEGVNATFGAFANFDDRTGELQLYKTKYFTDATAADKGGAPGHSTWMIERGLITALRYDEDLSSAIDNNFALRSVRSGVVWAHTGKVHTLRRMHDAQITVTDTDRQLAAARGAYDYFTFISAPWALSKLRSDRGAGDYDTISDGDDESLIPYLPDHLVRRKLTAVTDTNQTSDAFECVTSDGSVINLVASEDLKWSDLAGFRGKVNLEGLAAARDVDGPASSHLHYVLTVLRSMGPAKEVSPEIVAVDVLMTEDSEATASLDGEVTAIRHGESRWWWWSGNHEIGRDSESAFAELEAMGEVRVEGTPDTVKRLAHLLLFSDLGSGSE